MELIGRREKKMSTQKILKEFEIIYKNTYNKILKYVICKCSNLDDVNDIIQETYIEFYKKLKENKKIQDKQRYALEQRGGAERQYDDKERRQRIALHEARQGVDDCQYEIHSDFGLHLHKGMENYAYFN